MSAAAPSGSCMYGFFVSARRVGADALRYGALVFEDDGAAQRDAQGAGVELMPLVYRYRRNLHARRNRRGA